MNQDIEVGENATGSLECPKRVHKEGSTGRSNNNTTDTATNISNLDTKQPQHSASKSLSISLMEPGESIPKCIGIQTYYFD